MCIRKAMHFVPGVTLRITYFWQIHAIRRSHRIHMIYRLKTFQKQPTRSIPMVMNNMVESTRDQYN